MSLPNVTMLQDGTSQVLIKAVVRGARIAVACRRRQGLDDETIRRELVANFRKEFPGEGQGAMLDETLMAVLQRSIEEALAGI